MAHGHPATRASCQNAPATPSAGHRAFRTTSNVQQGKTNTRPTGEIASPIRRPRRQSGAGWRNLAHRGVDLWYPDHRSMHLGRAPRIEPPPQPAPETPPQYTRREPCRIRSARMSYPRRAAITIVSSLNLSFLRSLSQPPFNNRKTQLLSPVRHRASQPSPRH